MYKHYLMRVMKRVIYFNYLFTAVLKIAFVYKINGYATLPNSYNL